MTAFPERQLIDTLRVFVADEDMDARLDEIALDAEEVGAADDEEIFLVTCMRLVADPRITREMVAVAMVAEGGIPIASAAVACSLDIPAVEAALAAPPTPAAEPEAPEEAPPEPEEEPPPEPEVIEPEIELEPELVEPELEPEPEPEVVEPEPEPEPEPEVVEAPPEPELVEPEPEPEPEVVEAPPEPELVEAEPEPEPEVVEAPPEPEVVEAAPEAEVVPAVAVGPPAVGLGWRVVRALLVAVAVIAAGAAAAVLGIAALSSAGRARLAQQGVDPVYAVPLIVVLVLAGVATLMATRRPRGGRAADRPRR